MIDQNNDVTFSTLSTLIAEFPNLGETVKCAQVGVEVRERLPVSSFADRTNRRFPVHTSADAILSKAYATKVANLAEGVMSEIDTALAMYGVSEDIFTTAKVASVEDEVTYLLEEQKKIPFGSSTSIKEAEEQVYVNRKKLTPKTLSDASTKLIKEAYSRGEEVSLWTLKYSGLVQSDTEEASRWIEARADKAPTSKLQTAFGKLAEVVKHVDSTIDRDQLIKVASTLGSLDEEAGFTSFYGKKLPDPISTIFNTKLAMQPMVDMGSKQVPLEALLAVDPRTYGDLLGDDILDEIASEGELVPETLAEIFETLPKDMQEHVIGELGL